MENELITTTGIEATAEQIKERLGKYDFLRITEDAKGLHVYNIELGADMLLYHKPVVFLGHTIYGRILYERRNDSRLIEKPQFDRAIQKLFAMAEEIREGKA